MYLKIQFAADIVRNNVTGADISVALIYTGHHYIVFDHNYEILVPDIPISTTTRFSLLSSAASPTSGLKTSESSHQ